MQIPYSEITQTRTIADLRKLAKLYKLGSDIISGVIILNFVSITLSTISIFKPYSSYLLAFDEICLWIFIVEIVVRILLGGKSFFIGRRCGWNYFDLSITAISALSAIPALSALRVARMLRLFMSMRLLSSVKHLRKITGSLVKALPAMGWLGILLLMINLIYAVMGTIIFGETFPDRYGNIVSSFYAMIELMTMEGWTDVARAVMEVFPWAWIFFLSYIIFGGYILMNAVCGVIVEGMMSSATEESTKREQEMLDQQVEMQKQINHLHEKLDNMSEHIFNLMTEKNK